MARRKQEIILEAEDGESFESSSALLLRDLIRKELKDSSVALASDETTSDISGFISTGWTLLDVALGGGLPLGRTVELYGRESSGKTTLALQSIAQCQAQKGIPIYLDLERTLPKGLAASLGVDLKRLIVLEDITLEKTFDYIERLVSTSQAKFPEAPIMIVWDTLGATPLDGQISGSGQTGAPYRGKVVREGMRLLTGHLAKSKTCLLILNHVHEVINSGASWGSGPLLVTSGGMGVKYSASARIYLRTGSQIKDDSKRVLGQEVIARIDKNKMNPPKGEVASRLYFGGGFRDEWSIYDFLKEREIIKQSGAWASIPGPGGVEHKKYPSKFTDLLDEHPGLLDYLKTLAAEAYKLEIPKYGNKEEIETD